MAEGASILLIEDHPTVRMGLSMLLARDHHWICGEAGNRRELLTALSLLEPDRADLALLDLSLGSESGLELIADLHKKNIPVLVYSMHEDEAHIRQSFAKGAQGFVCKRETSGDLLAAVREVLAGNRHLSPLAAQNFSKGRIDLPQSPGDKVLTDREQQIVTLLGQGHSNQEIANKLFISVRTLETHGARAIEKLNLGGMRDLRRFAITKQRNEEISYT